MIEDHEIMLSVKNGNIQRLEELFSKYSKGLYNYFRFQIKDGSASEDLVQNVFYSILKYRHTFKEGADFKTWMYSIARNEKVSFFKKNKVLNSEINPEMPEEGKKNPEEDMIDRTDVNHLKIALEGISPDNREIITMYRFSGLPYSRIAEIVGCGVGALKVRMYRAMNELKEQFQKVSGE